MKCLRGIMSDNGENSKNRSFVLHVGDRNVSVVDEAVSRHPDLECRHLDEVAHLIPYIKEDLPDIILLESDDGTGDLVATVGYIQRNARIPVILISPPAACSVMVRALREGADNILCEPLEADNVSEAILEALRLRILWSEVHATQDTKRSSFGDIIGASPAMRTVYGIIQNVAGTAATVLISGASGTGKELVARAIHENSPRCGKPFVAVNCGAIPPNLLESELFGHEKGAFTGAIKRGIGKFEQASGATLFLDEICEMPIDLQVNLLRAIQEKIVTRIGGTEEIPVDVRIICATNRDPLGEVRAGRFREDLYYRLNVVPIRIPSLSERRRDIPLLCAHFLHIFTEKYSKYFYEFSREALDRLCSYEWPGNVRELENVIERVVVLHDGSIVEEHFLPSEIRSASIIPLATSGGSAAPRAVARDAVKPIWRMEAEMIQQALAATGGNAVEASKLLEIGQASLYRKLKKYGINRADYA